MIVTIEASDRDSHYADTEHKPMAMGIPSFCGRFEFAPQEIEGGTDSRATCVYCRHKATMSQSAGNKAVLVPYDKRKKPTEPL